MSRLGPTGTQRAFHICRTCWASFTSRPARDACRHVPATVSKAVLLAALLVTTAACAARRAPDLHLAPLPTLAAHLDVLPVAVRLLKMHAYVTDPYYVFHCPSEEWDFPDGTSSLFVEDCDPEVLLPYHAGHVYRLRVPPGEFVVRVTFKSVDKTLSALARVDVP